MNALNRCLSSLSSILRAPASVLCVLSSVLCLRPLSSVLCHLRYVPYHLPSVCCIMSSVTCPYSCPLPVLSALCPLSAVFQRLPCAFHLSFIFCLLSSVFCPLLSSALFCRLSCVLCSTSSYVLCNLSNVFHILYFRCPMSSVLHPSSILCPSPMSSVLRLLSRPEPPTDQRLSHLYGHVNESAQSSAPFCVRVDWAGETLCQTGWMDERWAAPPGFIGRLMVIAVSWRYDRRTRRQAEVYGPAERSCLFIKKFGMISVYW